MNGDQGSLECLVTRLAVFPFTDRQLEPVAPNPPVATDMPKDPWVVVAASFKHFERQRANDQLATLEPCGNSCNNP